MNGYVKTSVNVPNFSYNFIEADTVITIPVFQQMLVYQEIEIELAGELEVDGELGVIE